jgi:hypothetical protein
MGGVGKSALARSFLHQVRDAFDAQLYAAFTDAEAVTPSDVLLGFLRALGQHEEALDRVEMFLQYKYFSGRSKGFVVEPRCPTGQSSLISMASRHVTASC